MTQEVWILWSNVESTVYGIFSSEEVAKQAAISLYDDDDEEFDASDWSYIRMPLDAVKVL